MKADSVTADLHVESANSKARTNESTHAEELQSEDLLALPDLFKEPATRRPSAWTRMTAVWWRHWIGVRSTLIANALPACAEPILFLAAIGLGLGQYITQSIGGLPFGAWMGAGVLAMTAMWTASFETTYGTFVRMVYQKTYAAMIVTPVTVRDAFLGELLWCGTKGFAFTTIVCLVFVGFGSLSGWLPYLSWTILFIPVVGFVAAVLFGAIGMIVTSQIQNLNNYNFYWTGLLTPMTFFSGMLFPASDLPPGLEQVAYVLPLFHVTELNRLLLFGDSPERVVDWVVGCAIYLLVLTPIAVALAVRLLRRRVQA